MIMIMKMIMIMIIIMGSSINLVKKSLHILMEFAEAFLQSIALCPLFPD